MGKLPGIPAPFLTSSRKNSISCMQGLIEEFYCKKYFCLLQTEACHKALLQSEAFYNSYKKITSNGKILDRGSA